MTRSFVDQLHFPFFFLHPYDKGHRFESKIH